MKSTCYVVSLFLLVFGGGLLLTGSILTPKSFLRQQDYQEARTTNETVQRAMHSPMYIVTDPESNDTIVGTMVTCCASMVFVSVTIFLLVAAGKSVAWAGRHKGLGGIAAGLSVMTAIAATAACWMPFWLAQVDLVESGGGYDVRIGRLLIAGTVWVGIGIVLYFAGKNSPAKERIDRWLTGQKTIPVIPTDAEIVTANTTDQTDVPRLRAVN